MAAAAFSLSSCGDPTFDKDNAAESLKEMGEDLNDDQKKEFAKAIITLTLKEKGNQAALYEKIDGKTAEEIIEMAK